MKEQIKKVVLAALVAAVSIAAQAGTMYSWVFGVYDSDAEKNKSTYSAYIFAISDTAAGSAGYGNKTVTEDSVWEALSKGSSGTLPTTIGGNISAVLRDNNSYIEYSSNCNINGDYDLSASTFMALILNSSSLSTATKYIVAKTSDGTAVLKPSDGGTSSQVSSKIYSWNWGVQASTSWTDVGTIPEPTSGLLLVLGMATLALRRRRV